MIELSTIFNKNADGNFLSLRKFKCEHCDHQYPMTEFHKAVFLYGVYFLISPTDGYLGTKCINPKCTRTLSFKGTREEVDYIKNDLFSFLDFGDFQLQPDFRYHSPLKWSPDQYSFLKLFDIMHATWDTGGLDAETIDMYVRDHEQNEPYLTDEYYKSFVDGCGLPIGYTLPVWWFKKEQVENLIKIEDEKQIRIFPRYMIYDPLYSEIQSFCWKYYFAQKYYASMNLPENAEIKSGNIDKGIIAKNYDFSLILESDPYPTTNENQMVISLAGHTCSYIKINIDRLNNETDLMKSRLIEHDKMVNELWKNYPKSSIQQQLSSMSIKFNYEYLELFQRTDFTFDTVWSLKENYLNEVYRSIKSRRQMALKKRKSQAEERKLIDTECPDFKNIFSYDHKIHEIKRELTNLAISKKKNKIFLVLGDSGTGKQLFAEGIHKASGKGKKPLLTINCSIPSDELITSEMFGHKKGSFTSADKDNIGKFQAADGGTLFLDEIGNLNTINQGKLLTVLSGNERRFTPLGSTEEIILNDITVVLATNKNLDEEVKNHKFLFDLYMRINTFSYKIPSLAERGRDDLNLLTKKLIKKAAKDEEKPKLITIWITNPAMKIIKECNWTGNVRELENVIIRIIALRPENDTQDIYEDEVIKALDNLGVERKRAIKRIIKPAEGKYKMLPLEEIEKLLAENDGNQKRVSEIIGVAPAHFYREYAKMKGKK